MGASGLSSRAIIGRFYQKLEILSGQSWVDKISMLFGSDQPSETYKWLGYTPALREWLGGRNAKGLRENGITIENKIWEATLEVLTDDLRRDKTGQIDVRIGELAQRAVTHYASLLSTLILNGGSTLAYDGQFFFDTDHAEGANVTNQSNDISVTIAGVPAAVHGTTSTPSPEEFQFAMLKATATLLAFRDDQNEPMNEEARSFLVQVPTNMWTAAAAAVRSPMLGNGASSVVANLDGYRFDVAVNPRLDSVPTKFNVFRTDGQAKPFIRQEEEGVTVDALGLGSEYEFINNRQVFGIKAIRNVGYGYWQHAVRVTLA
ncbi:MAG: hypothetical protein QOG85_2234 [Gaiellaceae bacterium]|jgi:phage major head subunit gpT-like protein|nr:hypothetical protein [Gaiellaceae bacterium]